MLSVINVNENIFNEKFPNTKIFQNDIIYLLNLNEKSIGYAAINEHNVYNIIRICILNEYQGNRYGSYLFNEMLKIINKDIILEIDIDNYKMIRIINRCKGKELRRNNKGVLFLIPQYNDRNNNKV